MSQALTVVLIPQAINAGLTDPLFYASIAAGFAIAYPVAYLANRYLIARGNGHAVVHEHHGHGSRAPKPGPNPERGVRLREALEGAAPVRP